MTHDEALKVAQDVQQVIKDLPYYVSIVIKSNGERQVIIRIGGKNEN